MNKLVALTAATVLSASMASPVLADNGDNGQGFEHSGQVATCLNAGAGDGGEFVTSSGCGKRSTERSRIIEGPESDPGNSSFINQAPPLPPGQ